MPAYLCKLHPPRPSFVLDMSDDAELRDLTESDPTIRSGRGVRWEPHAMPFGATHA